MKFVQDLADLALSQARFLCQDFEAGLALAGGIGAVRQRPHDKKLAVFAL